MNNFSLQKEITFNDVLLLPNESDFKTSEEKEVINLSGRVTKNLHLRLPILSSPMPSITEESMAIALAKVGALGIIHPFQNFERQLEQVKRVKRANLPVAASISNTTSQGFERVEKLLAEGVDLISIETLHAHNTQTIHFIQTLKKKFKKIEILAGVVVTPEATEALINAGADGVRVGIGGGSHCTTRLVTGIGRPQLSALKECYEVTKKYDIPLISDTGIQYPGDVAKAIVFGADAVMIGGLFSGYDETPGEIILKNGRKYKKTWGICTRTAMLGIRGLEKEKTFYSRILTMVQRLIIKRPSDTKHDMLYLEEGVEGLAQAKGTIVPFLNTLESSLRRTMWYTGTKNLQDLRSNTKTVLVSANTLAENLPRI